MDFKRNFPLDEENEARTVQALISAGIPIEIAFSRFSWVDDPAYIMDILEAEKENIVSLADDDKPSQDMLYKYQISMIQEYADKVKSGEMTEEAAMKLLKHAVLLPEDDIRDLLGLGKREDTEDEMEDILQQK